MKSMKAWNDGYAYNSFGHFGIHRIMAQFFVYNFTLSPLLRFKKEIGVLEFTAL